MEGQAQARRTGQDRNANSSWGQSNYFSTIGSQRGVHFPNRAEGAGERVSNLSLWKDRRHGTGGRLKQDFQVTGVKKTAMLQQNAWQKTASFL